MSDVERHLSSIDRRSVLKAGAIGAALLAAPPLLSGCSSTPKGFESPPQKLAIPPLLDSKQLGHDVRVAAQNGQHEFMPGVASVTRGFNGNYLGPTIRLYKGEDTRVRFENQLDEPITVHGHGLHVPGDVDGGPQSVIDAGATWDITLPIKQEAATCWYHPHLMGKTAEHVHSGLAGLYLIEDDTSESLPLPKEYGVDDIPLVVQDRTITGDGVMKPYAITMEEMVAGLRENTLVVNGTLNPYVDVAPGWVRFRLLNGANSRTYKFSFADGSAFHKIATEGGFLPAPVELTSMVMSAGERNEILVDLSNGQGRQLMVEFVPNAQDDKTWSTQALDIRVVGDTRSPGELPSSLGSITPLQRANAVKTREFSLDMDIDAWRQSRLNGGHGSHSGGMSHKELFGINGRPMEIDRIDENVTLGDTEIWRITTDFMEHPFHIHGISFLLLSHNGNPPKPEDQGWKDTVYIQRGETELIATFDTAAPVEFPYMYHCHMMEHEEGGMMGQFTVA